MITNLGKSVRASRSLSAEKSLALLKALKSLGFTVTQLFDAAFAVASFRYNPVFAGDVEEAHVATFPAV